VQNDGLAASVGAHGDDVEEEDIEQGLGGRLQKTPEDFD
jgi:hypothetical protein